MKEKSIVLLLGGIAVAACVSILGYYFGWPKYQAYTAEQANGKIIAVAHAKVAAELIDPASAQFRESGVRHGETVCGQVNGKNRFGAYVGFRWFQVSSAGVVIDSPETSIRFAETMCK